MNNQKTPLETKVKTKIAQRVFIGILVLVGLAGVVFLAISYFQPPPPTLTQEQLWANFQSNYGKDWKMEKGKFLTIPEKIIGYSVPVSKIDSTKTKVTKDDIDSVSKKFMADNPKLLQVNVINLRQQGDAFIEEAPEKISSIHYEQLYQNIPVKKSLISLAYKNDKLVLYNAKYYPDINVPTTPSITQEEAARIAKENEVLNEYLQYPESGANPEWTASFNPRENKAIFEPSPDLPPVKYEDLKLKEAKLVIYPKESTIDNTISYSLAWQLDFNSYKAGNTSSKPVYYIDAQNGEFLARENRIFYLTKTSPQGDINGTVNGLVYPYYPSCAFGQTPCDQAGSAVNPFKGENVSAGAVTAQTNTSGQYTLSGLSGTVTLNSELKGPYVDVNNLAQTDAKHTATLAVPTTHNWNWQSNDTSYKYEESNVFYHTNFIHDYFTKGSPFDITAMNFVMKAYVQQPDFCNAYFTTEDWSINFFIDGYGCEASSLGSDVIYHEYTHGVTEKIYGEGILVYAGESGAMHEGYSDYYALTNLNRSTVGDGIFPYSIRNLDNTNRYPDDMVGQVHHDSLIFSGALWDLREYLGKDLTDNLVIRTEKLKPLNFTSFLDNLIVVDDDDGNLGNGTPHGPQICDSFYTKHNIWSDFCMGNTLLPTAIISAPGPGEMVPSTGTVQIYGTAYPSKGATFDHYTIEYGLGINPSTWSSSNISLYNNGLSQRKNALLGSWTATGLFGTYSLKLTVYDSNGNSSITSRFSLGVRAGWPQKHDFMRSSAAIAEIDPSNNALEIVYTTGFDSQLDIKYANGASLSGWPQCLDYYNGGCWDKSDNSAALVEDLDPVNNNGKEIIVGTRDMLWGFRQNGTQIFHYYPKSVQASPVAADLDPSNNQLEYVIASTNGSVYAYYLENQINQTLLPGWPQATGGAVWGTPAIANIDPSTPTPEIVAGSFDNKVYAWHADGTLVPGWPQTTDEAVFTSAAIADLDGNGDYEIVASDYLTTYVWHHDGRLATEWGWPKPFGAAGWIFYGIGASPVVADIDPTQAGLEILLGSFDKVYAWNYNGNTVSGWPKDINGFATSSIVGDIDISYPGPEIIVGSWDNYKKKGYLYAFHADGTLIDGWPLILNELVDAEPTLGDLDGDGKLEMVMISCFDYATKYYGYISVWNLPYTYDSNNLEWPRWHRDNRNTGFYNQCSDYLPWGQCHPETNITCDQGNLVPCPVGKPVCHPERKQCEGVCSDGTFYNECSITKPKYCNLAGILLDVCYRCGCPSDYPYCNPSTSSCEKKCPDGTEFSKCNPNTHQYCDNGILTPCPTNKPRCDASTLLCTNKCTDGTLINQCSAVTPKLYCNEKGQLVYNCDKCAYKCGTCSACIGGVCKYCGVNIRKQCLCPPPAAL